MKNCILLLSIIVTVSCGDPEVKDPKVGDWMYNSLDLSGLPVINAKFSLNKSGNSYQADKVTVTIDGLQINDMNVQVANGDDRKIVSIIFENGNDKITMTNANKSISYPGWFIERVVYVKNGQLFDYYGQTLKPQ